MVGPCPRKSRSASNVVAPVACQASMNQQNKTDFPTTILKFAVALGFPQTGQISPPSM